MQLNVGKFPTAKRISCGLDDPLNLFGAEGSVALKPHCRKKGLRNSVFRPICCMQEWHDDCPSHRGWRVGSAKNVAENSICEERVVMKASRIFSLALVVSVTVFALHCSKSSSSPTQPMTPTPPPPSLIAVPTSASITVGATENVTVSGGTPPYLISSAPGSIATASILNPDSVATFIHITGVTVSSVSTAVVIRDNSNPTPRTVSVPIIVQ